MSNRESWTEEQWERERAASRRYYQRNRERRLNEAKKYYGRYAKSESEKLRAKKNLILEHYGAKCSCPGCDVTIRDFLTFDHIGGWKKVHPGRETRLPPKSFYAWIIKNNFPDTIRVLCMNCNWAIREGYRSGGSGKCPHENEIDRVISNWLSGLEHEIPSSEEVKI
jgi:hypothetical protein